MSTDALKISTVRHWIFGLRETMYAKNGEAIFSIFAERDQITRGAEIRIRIENHPYVTIGRDGDWYVCMHAGSVLKFRPRYPDDARDPHKFEVLFLAPSDWRLTWDRHTESRKRDPE